MNDIHELKRLPSPAPKPQSLAWDGHLLWMGSRQTRRIYGIDPQAWRVTWETEAPGTPYGITVFGGDLLVLCGESADDNRIVRRCIPGKGFDPSFGIPCPDDTGSQLANDGSRLTISQWYPKKVIAVDAKGHPQRVIQVQHGICGQVHVDGAIYLMTTDDEETTDYWLTRLDPRDANPQPVDLVRVPFAARALAWDGTHFWTNHREANQIVCFPRPD